MVLKFSESAKLVFYKKNLKLFGPSRAPLDPSGGKSDHPKAFISRQKWLPGPSDFVFFSPKREI